MDKILVFDMDGTIVDLYGVDNWLEKLRSEDVTPYTIAKPLYDIELLNTILNTLKVFGWRIAVTSWTPKGGEKEYNKRVRQAKINWLLAHNFPFDEIHIVKYGTTKADCTRKLGGMQILVDDNAKVREGWNLGGTIDANKNILIELINLMETA
jgi:hypothetical protein